jgi:hypothetical protein
LELEFDREQAQQKHPHNKRCQHGCHDNRRISQHHGVFHPSGFAFKQISSRLNQNGLVRFQIFLDGFYAVAGIGDPDGVGLAQFVMHQQFANHSHLKIGFWHPPELTGFQRLLANAVGRLNFYHGSFCALIFCYTS